MLCSAPSSPEQLISRLIHDLRQPLGNIGLSSFYIDLMLDEQAGKIHEQIHAIQDQVERASRLLAQAAEEIGRLAPAQSAELESRELTNRATSALT